MLNKVYHIFFLLLVMICIQSCKSNKTLPDLRETFSYQDVRPFGSSVAFAIFKNAYPDKISELTKKPFAENYNWDHDTASFYLNVSRNFYLAERDADAILDFVYKGNTAFISAAYIDTVLLTKISCKQRNDLNYLFTQTPAYQATALHLENHAEKDSFRYFYYPFTDYFYDINSSRKIGYNDSGNTNLLEYVWGKGRLYLHSEPRALSNYFLLSHNNYRYLQEIMQMLPAEPENFYWDDYYWKNNHSKNAGKSFSTLTTLMKYPSFTRAFFISLFLLLLYILFNSKRRQRTVPVIKPVENNSIAFTEAIAGLYLAKKDNKIIVEKIINYFNEHVRTKYFLTGNFSEATYADSLSRKSGIPREITEPLINTIEILSATDKVNDEQLLSLNGLIEKFLKYKV